MYSDRDLLPRKNRNDLVPTTGRGKRTLPYSLVPKFHLGTQSLLKFYFPILCPAGVLPFRIQRYEVELRERVRSQMEFGNEPRRP